MDPDNNDELMTSTDVETSGATDALYTPADGAQTIREHLELGWETLMEASLGLLVLAVVALGVHFIVSRVIVSALKALAERTPTWWDNVLVEQGVFHRAALITPAVVVHVGIAAVGGLTPTTVDFVQRVTLALIAIFAARGVASFLGGVNTIYTRYESSRNRPIKGYIQVLQIIIYLVAVILAFAALMNRSPWFFFTGLGAMTAVLLLVFRDSLLSLVAGVQLTANDLVRVGDWIEMPSFGADGDVIDIALNTVQVRNWDRTVTTVPTHKFLEHSFKNWRPMFEGGGRRIKRSIHLDVSTVRFLTQDEIDELRRIRILREYIDAKESEIREQNERALADGVPDCTPNRRMLTNVGTFRAYCQRYIENHSMVHPELISMVRQLQPTPQGLPLEIYCFIKDTRWVMYEGAQSDIFDHLLAILPSFGLRVFQEPTGVDMREAFGAEPAKPRPVSAPPR